MNKIDRLTLEDTLRRVQALMPKGGAPDGRRAEPGRKESEHHLGVDSLRASLWGAWRSSSQQGRECPLPSNAAGNKAEEQGGVWYERGTRGCEAELFDSNQTTDCIHTSRWGAETHRCLRILCPRPPTAQIPERGMEGPREGWWGIIRVDTG